MFIPNCEKETYKGYYDKEEVSNDYFQGYLSEEDANKVIAYDFLSDIIKGFDFSIIDLYLERDLTEKEYIALKKLEILSIENPEVSDIISMAVQGMISDLKNDEVISMIEHYNDEEYQKNRIAYENGFKNILIRYKEKGGIND